MGGLPALAAQARNLRVKGEGWQNLRQQVWQKKVGRVGRGPVFTPPILPMTWGVREAHGDRSAFPRGLWHYQVVTPPPGTSTLETK